MSGRFKNPVIYPNGVLKVEGPFITDGEVLGEVLVRFLIIPDGKTKPVFGTATVTGLSTTGRGTSKITTGTFREMVHGSDLEAGTKVRGVGISLAVKKARRPDPPAIDTFTWCVDLVVVRGRGNP